LGFSTNATSSNDPVFGTTLNTGSRTKLDWQGNVKLDAGETLVLGAETARDAIHRPVAAGTTTNAGFAELQSALGALNNSVSIRYDDNSRFGSKVTWREAPEYAIAATGTRVHASIGTGFKAPSLNDLFQNLPAFGFSANPNLKPETSLGYDVGLDQTLFDGVTAGVTWFHNDIKNLITNNASFTTNVNIGKARTQGVESYLAWNVLDTLSLRADYTYTDATDLVAHTELLRRPRNKVSLGADWQALPNLSLNATLVYTGPQIDVNRETFVNGKQPDFTVLNIAANYRFSDALTLFGRVDNLLDQRYQNPNGFQRPGIGAFAGVKASF
jgi:vitamin B12 transporter